MNLPNGTFTIVNPEGQHKTFRIKTQPQDAKFAPGERLLELMVGPDNENSFRGIAFVAENGIHLWRSQASHENQWFVGLFERLALERTDEEVECGNITINTPKGERTYGVIASKRCMRCNRKLTTPESCEKGIGPKCEEMVA